MSKNFPSDLLCQVVFIRTWHGIKIEDDSKLKPTNQVMFKFCYITLGLNVLKMIEAAASYALDVVHFVLNHSSSNICSTNIQ